MCGCNDAAKRAVLEQKFGRQIINSGYMDAYKAAGENGHLANFIPTNAHKVAGTERGNLGAKYIPTMSQPIPVVRRKMYRGVLPISQQPRVIKPEPFHVPTRS